jgi:MFS family permease
MYVETMVAPALPDLINEFDISYNTAPWILTSYLVVAVVMTPIMGSLSDTYGRKRILLAGLVIYAVGTFAAGFATNIYFMLIARAVQGVGIGIFPVAVAIVRNQSTEKKLAFNQGIITSMFATGAVIGLAAGGTIIHYLGWRATFFTILPIVIILIVLVWRFIYDIGDDSGKNTHKHDSRLAADNRESQIKFRIDIKGAVVFSIGITSVLLIITNVDDKMSPTDWSFIGILSIIGIVSLYAFYQIENRVQFPLMDFKVVLTNVLLSANILRMIAGLFMFAILSTMPILIRNPKPAGFGESAINTASIIVPFMMAYLIVGLSSGLILSKLGNIRVILAGSVISAAGFTTLALFFHSLVHLLAGLAILGIGSQMLHQGAININLVSTPRHQTGISFGISNVFYLLGSAIGPTIVGMYMHANQLSINGVHSSYPSHQAYFMIFSTGIALSLLTIIIDILISKKKKNS